MKYKLIVPYLALTVFLVGCNESNPLENHAPEKIALYLLEKSKVPLAKCAKIWANPEASNDTVLTECDPVATETAILLNEGGFGPRVSFQNVQMPQIWPLFLEQLETHNQDLKIKARDAFDWNKGK